MARRNIVATLLVAACSLSIVSRGPLNAGVDWPPRLGERFPDLELIDQSGKAVRIADLKGSVLLVEYVGMSCPACQAFSDAHDRGGFGGVRPQPGLESIAKYFPRYTGGLSLGDERIVFVQILLYNERMGAPRASDARDWAKHFRLRRSKNEIVLAGTKDLLGQESFDLIPGFQLVDRNLVVRSDSTGHRPRHNLYTELLPLVPELLKARGTGPVSARLLGDPVAPASIAVESSRRRVTRGSDSKRAAMTVEEAYRAIPHRRTVFEATAGSMSRSERRFLSDFFELVDEAVVARVETMTQLLASAREVSIGRRYEALLKRFDRLDAPRPLREVKELVISAIKDQREYLEYAARKGGIGKGEIRGDPRVGSASRKLRKAYSVLMQRLSEAGQKNRQAFFDYLCALDFI